MANLTKSPPKKQDLSEALYSPPSLIPNIQYPITEREQHIIEAAYRKGRKDELRVNRAGRVVEDDPLLQHFRDKVEQIRKKKGLR